MLQGSPLAVQPSALWTLYDIVLDVEYSADLVLFGFLLQGEGQLHVADMRLDEAPTMRTTAQRRSILATAVNLDFTEYGGAEPHEIL